MEQLLPAGLNENGSISLGRDGSACLHAGARGRRSGLWRVSSDFWLSALKWGSWGSRPSTNAARAPTSLLLLNDQLDAPTRASRARTGERRRGLTFCAPAGCGGSGSQGSPGVFETHLRPQRDDSLALRQEPIDVTRQLHYSADHGRVAGPNLL